MATPAETFQLIRGYWPDLHFVKDDVFRGNPNFTKLFYQYLINDFNEKISNFFNEEFGRDRFDDLNFDDEVKLYCKVVNIFKRMQPNSLNLVDFYVPAGKKIYPIAKFAIHFIIYVDNYGEEVLAIINDNLTKLADCEGYKTTKQQLLEECAEIAENLAHVGSSSERLMQKSEEVKANHMKMLEDKINDERNEAQNKQEIKEIQSEIDRLEYELKLLEEKENQLQEAVVSDIEFERLKEAESCMEAELRQLQCDNSGTWDNDKDMEIVKRYEEFAKVLTNVELDSLNVHDLQKVRQDAIDNKNIVRTSQEELTSWNKTASDCKIKVDVLKQTLEKTQVFLGELKTKFATEEREEREWYILETKKCANNFEENQRVETLKAQVQEDITNLDNDERRLNTTVAQEYRRILILDKKTTTKFNKILLELSNGSL